MLEDAELEAGIAEQVANAKAILGETMHLIHHVHVCISELTNPRCCCACLAGLQMSLCMRGILHVPAYIIERHTALARAHNNACWNAPTL